MTETEKKVQGLVPSALGTQSGSRQEEILTSGMPVVRPNKKTKGKGKEKASESPAMTTVRSLGDWVIRNNS